MAAIAGTALAAGIPFLMEKLFGGKKEEMKQLPTMTPEVQALLAQLSTQLGGPLQAGMTNLQDILSNRPEAFDKFAAPYMREFNEQIVPNIAERYAGWGSGAQSSSAFPQELSQAGASLSERLAAMRGTMQQNAMSQLGNLMGIGLNASPFAYQYKPEQMGLGRAMAPAIGQAIGQQLPGQLSSGFQSLQNLFRPKPRMTPGPYGINTPGQYDMYQDITRY